MKTSERSKMASRQSARLSTLPLSKLTTILPHFEASARRHLNTSVASISKLHAGGNSQIYVLELKGRTQKLLVKKYYKDTIHRLEREYSAFTFLKQSSSDTLRQQVPSVLWVNEQEYYGVYSFEPGFHKSGEQVTENDLRDVMNFIINLQTYRRNEPALHFENALSAAISLNAYIHEVERRIKLFKVAVARGGVAKSVIVQVEKVQAEQKLQKFLGDFRKKYAERTLSAALPAEEARLSPMDFSLFSVLFREAKPPCFVDFEYFGWDDPLHMVADFLQHDRSQGIPRALQEAFIDQYRQQATGLSESTLQRLPLTLAILGAVWAARHLYFLTDEKIKPRKHAASDYFNLEVYIGEQLKKLEHRINRLEFIE